MIYKNITKLSNKNKKFRNYEFVSFKVSTHAVPVMLFLCSNFRNVLDPVSSCLNMQSSVTNVMINVQA
ncbi:CLUMA_CG010258, isoform A [Clunio marinus]|uniref:CLUMA_CG010258, isoform A n=1 Tax=Clunio marinus TaxID=568069 RepID=A0A1J1ID12_9DIPT|nr:CLUMA_CG010258, isoform A [Clunio marinus]